jgi:hypothetical protein
MEVNYKSQVPLAYCITLLLTFHTRYANDLLFNLREFCNNHGILNHNICILFSGFIQSLSTKVLSLYMFIYMYVSGISLIGKTLNNQKTHELKVTILHMYLWFHLSLTFGHLF